MEKLIDKFIEYLKVQKNYSDFTIINYGKDLEEYSEFLSDNKYKLTHNYISKSKKKKKIGYFFSGFTI